MKARVLFGVFGFAFVLLALYVFPPIVLELVVAALCVFATYEVLGSTKLVRNHLELLLAMAVSLGLAVGHFSILPLRLESVMQGLVLVLLFGSFAIELKYHDVMKASQVSWAFFGGLAVPYLLLSLLRIFQMHYHHGSFIVLLPLLAAWGADTCALFSGMLFGKHKLAPVVSPKKTVEGAVGGVVGGAVLVLIAAVIMNRTLDLEMPLWSAVVLGAVGAVLGEIGDLSFSVIKRQTGIKDYGHIFPGHGGVLDRFDSVLFDFYLDSLLCAFCSKRSLATMARWCVPSPIRPASSYAATLKVSILPFGAISVSSVSMRTSMPSGVAATWLTFTSVPTVVLPSSSSPATLPAAVFSMAAIIIGVANTDTRPLPTLHAS